MFERLTGAVRSWKIWMTKERELKHKHPIKYLRFRMNRVQKFVSTVKSMLKSSSLMLIYDDGAYRAVVTLDSSENSMDYQTLGYIFGEEFFLDCDLVYETMVQAGKNVGPSKQVYFWGLFREGVLKPYCHFRQYIWFRRYDDMDRVKGHKFFCVPTSILKLDWNNFLDVYPEI